MEELGRRARGASEGSPWLRDFVFFGILALGLVLAAGWSETSESLRAERDGVLGDERCFGPAVPGFWVRPRGWLGWWVGDRVCHVSIALNVVCYWLGGVVSFSRLWSWSEWLRFDLKLYMLTYGVGCRVAIGAWV